MKRCCKAAGLGLAVAAAAGRGANAVEVTDCDVVGADTGMLVYTSVLDRSFSLNEVRCGDSPTMPCEHRKEVSCAAADVPAGGYTNLHAYVHHDMESGEVIQNGCYAKVAYQVDTAAERLGDCMAIGTSAGVMDAFAECERRVGCNGVGVFQVPNMPPSTACFYKEVSSFAPVKLSFPGKLFLRRESCEQPPTLYGYDSSPSDVAGKGLSSLQTFTAKSGYAEAECESMCDALESCKGIVMEGGVCRQLLGSADGEAVAQVSGDFFAKTTLETEEPSPFSDIPSWVLPAGAGGGAVLAVAALLVVRKRVTKSDDILPIRSSLRKSKRDSADVKHLSMVSGESHMSADSDNPMFGR